MDAQEREFILASAARHTLRESSPEPFDDPYYDMTSEEKSKLLIMQQRLCDDANRRAEEAERKAAEAEAERRAQSEKIDELLKGQSRMQADLSSLVRQLTERDRLVEELRKTIADLEARRALSNRNTFGSKSQKGSKKKKGSDDMPPHDKNKGDFDGTTGSNSIDNNVAERFIRPLTGKRKNSLFFGSHRMARAAAVFHTVVSTCRACGISALSYLKKFFAEIVRGNRDYDTLLPQTLAQTL